MELIPSRKLIAEAVEERFDIFKSKKLVRLADLCRMRWVGATFSKLIYDAGICDCEALSQAEGDKLYKKLMQLNKDEAYTKGKFSAKDMKMCIDFAQMMMLID